MFKEILLKIMQADSMFSVDLSIVDFAQFEHHFTAINQMNAELCDQGVVKELVDSGEKINPVMYAQAIKTCAKNPAFTKLYFELKKNRKELNVEIDSKEYKQFHNLHIDSIIGMCDRLSENSGIEKSKYHELVVKQHLGSNYMRVILGAAYYSKVDDKSITQEELGEINDVNSNLLTNEIIEGLRGEYENTIKNVKESFKYLVSCTARNLATHKLSLWLVWNSARLGVDLSEDDIDELYRVHEHVIKFYEKEAKKYSFQFIDGNCLFTYVREDLGFQYASIKLSRHLLCDFPKFYKDNDNFITYKNYKQMFVKVLSKDLKESDYYQEILKTSVRNNDVVTILLLLDLFMHESFEPDLSPVLDAYGKATNIYIKSAFELYLKRGIQEKIAIDLLCLACSIDAPKICDLILATGVDTNQPTDYVQIYSDRYMMTNPPIKASIPHCFVQGIVGNDSKLEACTPVIKAIEGGNEEILNRLHEANADFNFSQNSNGLTPLHHAVNSRRTGLFRILVGKGADLSAKMYVNDHGETPLAVAACRERLDCVRELLELGKKNGNPDQDIAIARLMATLTGNMEVVNLIDEYYPYEKNKYGFLTGTTPLKLVALKGLIDSVEYYLKQEPEMIKATDKRGYSVLQCILDNKQSVQDKVIKDHCSVFKRLIEVGGADLVLHKAKGVSTLVFTAKNHKIVDLYQLLPVVVDNKDRFEKADFEQLILELEYLADKKLIEQELELLKNINACLKELYNFYYQNEMPSIKVQEIYYRLMHSYACRSFDNDEDYNLYITLNSVERYPFVKIDEACNLPLDTHYADLKGYLDSLKQHRSMIEEARKMLESLPRCLRSWKRLNANMGKVEKKLSRMQSKYEWIKQAVTHVKNRSGLELAISFADNKFTVFQNDASKYKDMKETVQSLIAAITDSTVSRNVSSFEGWKKRQAKYDKACQSLNVYLHELKVSSEEGPSSNSDDEESDQSPNQGEEYNKQEIEKKRVELESLIHTITRSDEYYNFEEREQDVKKLLADATQVRIHNVSACDNRLTKYRSFRDRLFKSVKEIKAELDKVAQEKDGGKASSIIAQAYARKKELDELFINLSDSSSQLKEAEKALSSKIEASKKQLEKKQSSKKQSSKKRLEQKPPAPVSVTVAKQSRVFTPSESAAPGEQDYEKPAASIFAFQEKAKLRNAGDYLANGKVPRSLQLFTPTGTENVKLGEAGYLRTICQSLKSLDDLLKHYRSNCNNGVDFTNQIHGMLYFIIRLSRAFNEMDAGWQQIFMSKDEIRIISNKAVHGSILLPHYCVEHHETVACYVGAICNSGMLLVASQRLKHIESPKQNSKQSVVSLSEINEAALNDFIALLNAIDEKLKSFTAKEYWTLLIRYLSDLTAAIQDKDFTLKDYECALQRVSEKGSCGIYFHVLSTYCLGEINSVIVHHEYRPLIRQMSTLSRDDFRGVMKFTKRCQEDFRNILSHEFGDLRGSVSMTIVTLLRACPIITNLVESNDDSEFNLSAK